MAEITVRDGNLAATHWIHYAHAKFTYHKKVLFKCSLTMDFTIENSTLVLPNLLAKKCGMNFADYPLVYIYLINERGYQEYF